MSNVTQPNTPQTTTSTSTTSVFHPPAPPSVLTRTEATDEQLSIKVVSQSGDETVFKLKKTTPLKKMMNAYAERQGVSLISMKFLFDGARIQPESTPEQLKMTDGEQIDVVLEQTGGGY